jgi:hypothetical protein
MKQRAARRQPPLEQVELGADLDAAALLRRRFRAGGVAVAELAGGVERGAVGGVPGAAVVDRQITPKRTPTK